MPIQIDDQQLGSINQTIQTTADIGTGAYTAAAAARAGNLFTDIGKNLSTKYGAMYGQQKATQDAMEQINKGAAGQFSHIANFTPYGDAYNAMMDKIAPNVLSADIGHKISLYANQVATDPNITIDKKVETLAKGVQGVIDESVSQLSPEWQDQVKLMTSMQGLDEQNKMVQHVANIQTAQQQIEVKSSLEKLKVQSAQSESVENAMLSYGALKENLDGLLSTGTISRQEHEAYNQDAKNSIALAQIDKHGMEKFKAWNDSSKMFSDQEMQQYQHMADVSYQQKQHSIEIDQMRNHINFKADAMGLLDGTKSMADITYAKTDAQITQLKDATIAQRLYQSARSMGESQQRHLMASAAFNSLDGEWKTMIRANLADLSHKRATGDLTDYGMNESTPFSQRLAAAQQLGISPDKLLTKKEQNQLKIAYISGDRQQVYQALSRKTNPQFADYYTKKFAGDPDTPMPAMLNPYAKTDQAYMLGSSAKGASGKTPTQKNAPTMYRALTMDGVSSDTKMAIYDHIQQASKGDPMATPEELFNQRYAVTSNGVVSKQHTKLITPENAEIVAKKLSQDKKQQVQIKSTIENGKIYPNFATNEYIISDPKGLKIAVPFNEVDQLSEVKSNPIKSTSNQRLIKYADNLLKSPGNLIGIGNSGEDE